MAHDVFISHSHQDKLAAEAACHTLEDRGIRCWIAPRDVTLGIGYGESIMDAISGARIMVLIFSDHANKSPQVEREIERAVSKGLSLIPIRIEDVVPRKSLEYFISSNHWLDAITPPVEQHLEKLAAACASLLEVVGRSAESAINSESASSATVHAIKPPTLSATSVTADFALSADAGVRQARSPAEQVVLPFTGLSQPSSVAVDGVGNVYVVDSGNSRVVALGAGSGMQSVLPFTGSPRSVAVDAAGNVYVADRSNDRVRKLAAGSSKPTKLPFDCSPRSVAVDDGGTVYVTHSPRTGRHPGAGSSSRVWALAEGSSTPTKLPFKMRFPDGVAVDAAGTVYVSAASDDRVDKLAAGASIASELPFTDLAEPNGVAVDLAGSVYVADAHNDRVVALAAGSSMQRVLPFTGLANPNGVAVDATGNVYVADTGNDRVLKLSAG
jgi:sugar lactone lactonase YvrE